MYDIRNKVYSYLNLLLLPSRMSKRTRDKVSYKVDETRDYLSDEEELGQREDDNGGDRSTDSEYNDDDDNLVPIVNNEWNLLYRKRNQT